MPLRATRCCFYDVLLCLASVSPAPLPWLAIVENHASDVNVAKRSEWPAAKTTIDLALVRRNLLDTVTYVSAPGTPNNHFLLNGCLVKHPTIFLYKDLESASN